MPTWAWVVVVVVAVLAIAGIAWAIWERRRRERLRERYGREYERVEEQEGSRGAAAELRQRERRRAALEIRPLRREERERFARAWELLQGRFVDDPPGAVREADRLVIQVMAARGYPMDDFEQRAEDLSVDHPRVVDNYRVAHATAVRSSRGEVDTEDLRRATLAYRELFEELLADEEGAGFQRTG